MELVLVGTCAVLLGGFAGYIYGKLRTRNFQDQYEELMRQEAAAQEKIRMLAQENETRSSELERRQATILGLTRELAQLQERLPSLEQQLALFKDEQSEGRELVATLNRELAQSQVLVGQLSTDKQLLEQQLKSLHEYVQELRTQSRLEFESLAHQVLDAKTKSFSEYTEKSLNTLLTPLKEKIQVFEKSVDEKYTTEAKERHALKSEIERLILLNDKMAIETNSLTLALKGDSKVQGDWGELVLERILEASGLRHGHEYFMQQSLDNDEGDRLRPDVIIQLPEEKHVIVDAKVSLKAFDVYRSNTDDTILSRALSDHIKSIEKHIDDLSSKHYARLKGINSPEFVFMFIPIEPAYVLAMQHHSDLSMRAWKKGVAIVTATTLFTSLKTVASIWRLEKQNKNALEIAHEGAKLYDKFVGFLEDFEKIGKTLESGQKQYDSAMGKLKDGPGNVFRKMEVLRELGAAPTKRISSELLD